MQNTVCLGYNADRVCMRSKIGIMADCGNT